MQSKTESFIESSINIGIGYVISMGAQLLLFPLYGIDISFTTNLWLGLWFTIISLARSYVIRRWFNARLHAAVHRLAQRA